MIYLIVDINTGAQHSETTLPSKWFKRGLARLNRSSLKSESRVKYAIACYLPYQIHVYHRWESDSCQQTDIRWFRWVSIKALPMEQRQRFWDWYGSSRSVGGLSIPADELLISGINHNGTLIYSSEKISKSLCNGCAYLLRGNPSICNAFHPKVGLDECPDFLSKETPNV